MHLRGAVLLAYNLETATLRPLQPRGSISSYDRSCACSICATRAIAKPVFAATPDRSLAVLTERDPGALRIPPDLAAVIRVGELLVDCEGESAEGCDGWCVPCEAVSFLRELVPRPATHNLRPEIHPQTPKRNAAAAPTNRPDECSLAASFQTARGSTLLTGPRCRSRESRLP